MKSPLSLLVAAALVASHGLPADPAVVHRLTMTPRQC